MIRLFSSDMDGTLLNNRSLITERTKEAIIKFQQLGGCFIVNTGREYSSAKKELDFAGISCDVICAGGAAVYDQYGELLEEHIIPRSLAVKIIDILDQYDMYVDIYTDIGKVSIVPAFEMAKYYHEQVLPASKKDGKIYFRSGEELKKLFEQTVHSMVPENYMILMCRSIRYAAAVSIGTGSTECEGHVKNFLMSA